MSTRDLLDTTDLLTPETILQKYSILFHEVDMGDYTMYIQAPRLDVLQGCDFARSTRLFVVKSKNPSQEDILFHVSSLNRNRLWSTDMIENHPYYHDILSAGLQISSEKPVQSADDDTIVQRVSESDSQLLTEINNDFAMQLENISTPIENLEDFGNRYRRVFKAVRNGSGHLLYLFEAKRNKYLNGGRIIATPSGIYYVIPQANIDFWKLSDLRKISRVNTLIDNAFRYKMNREVTAEVSTNRDRRFNIRRYRYGDSDTTLELYGFIQSRL